jgi:hypothetical protein
MCFIYRSLVRDLPSSSALYDLERSALEEEDKLFLKSNMGIISLVQKMEYLFKSFHGPTSSDFNRSQKVNKTLIDILVQKLSCDKVLAETFVKTRLNMRLRDCNISVRNKTMNCSNKSFLKYVVTYLIVLIISVCPPVSDTIIAATKMELIGPKSPYNVII